MLSWIGAAAAAGALAALGPRLLVWLPEPAEPAEDKTPYAVLAATPHLSSWLAAFAAFLAGLVAFVIDEGWLIPVWTVLMAVGVLLAFIDWHTKLLPRLIVLPLNAILILLVLLAALLEDDWMMAARAAVIAVVVFAIFWLSNLVFPRGLGYGDVRLSFGLALALGALGGAEAFTGIYAGFLLGAVGALLLSRLKIADTRSFAFGPYLVLGATLGAVGVPVLG